MPTILLAEDDPLQRRTVRRMLENDLSIQHIVEVANGAEALARLKRKDERRIWLALLDLDMPVLNGMEVLRQTKEFLPDLPFIVLTGSEKLEHAVEAMQLGAVDFITKPATRERLITAVRNAMAIQNLQEEVRRLQQDHSPHYSFDNIAEISPGLKELCALGKKASSSDIPIIITGESGVGKEVFARAIHLESKYRDKPFVPVNCGALPDNLVESTLFGHEKGAFTGAVTKTIGKCREADGGILFLDEVGELKLDTQVKLLRMLQQGEIEPVGSGKPMKVDVRVISATNRSLEQLVSQGRFREDLYYRLQGLPLHIPPLRERRRDVPGLAEHLLKRIAVAERKPNIRLSDDAEAWLSSYSWPGNVRELQHILARAVLLAEQDILNASDLARWAQGKALPAAANSSEKACVFLEGANGNFKTLEQIEHEVIEAALAHYGAHIGRAAAALGIGQSTLYKKLRSTAS